MVEHRTICAKPAHIDMELRRIDMELRNFRACHYFVVPLRQTTAHPCEAAMLCICCHLEPKRTI